MRLRNPLLIKTAALLGTAALRGLMATLRFEYRHLGPETVDPRHTGPGTRYIYAMWHETILLPAFHFGRRDIYVLIGQHADGELAAELCRFVRFRTIRGSTTRGGAEAVRQILRKTGRTAHLGITPDGPRGPRRRVQPGAVYLSARTGMPLIPAGFGFDRPWRLRSWDRFAVPRPFTRAVCVTCPPVVVPPGAGKKQLEHYRRVVEQAMLAATALAERWAETGRRPGLADLRLPEGAGPEGRRRAG